MSKPNPSATSEAMRAKAREMIARVQSGEAIPLDEIASFLEDSARSLQAQTTEKLPPPVKRQDVDFF
jgi:hypothetical protein